MALRHPPTFVGPSVAVPLPDAIGTGQGDVEKKLRIDLPSALGGLEIDDQLELRR
jgi:hypothetical protein